MCPISSSRIRRARRKSLAIVGLAAGSLVRIAAMDTYDGLAWGVANSAAASTGSSFGGFQRVGALLPGSVPGPTRTATIAVAVIGLGIATYLTIVHYAYKC